ncbi:MAG TPA: amidase [Blastocatellia bacterium]|nr:amidase [Blastocatellia bacterium]
MSKQTKRRQFLKLGTSACALAITGPALRASAETTRAAYQAKPFEFEEAAVNDLQNAMQQGRHTARSIAESYLARIDELDKHGPAINSVIELNPDALEIAEALDRERKAKGARGPLHGIPVLIKDNIDTADKMMTTAGSLALVGSKPPRDAFVVERLRAAGAVILGKTNLSEWANFRSTHSTSGWSGRGGLTRNPYALDRNTSGSSSGSGAATAANFTAIAVGTETDGSIVSPSTTCGLVGIKPTLGLVSRAGIIPIAHSQDTAGPMARTVTDATILLGALVGIDARDAATAESRGKAQADYTKFLDAGGLKGARIGVLRKSFGFNDRVDKLMQEAIDVMKRAGAEVIDPADIPTHGKFDDSEFEVLLYEFKADLNAYLATLGPQAPVHSLKEIIAFNEKNADKEMPYFGQEIMLKAEAKGPLTDAAYRKALEKDLRMSRKEGIDAVIVKHKLDALIAPTGGPAWKTDLPNGDHFTGGLSTAPAVAGYPHITVPAGFVYGLPVGISFTGLAWTEPTLIKLAFAYEQATKHRRPPKFLANVETV